MIRLFMQVSGVEPQATDEPDDCGIPLSSMSLKLDAETLAAPSGDQRKGRKPCVWITKESDATSPDLFGLCAMQQAVDQVRIIAGDPHELADSYVVRLTDVRIDSHDLTVADQAYELYESFQLSAAAMSVEYRGRVRNVRF